MRSLMLCSFVMLAACMAEEKTASDDPTTSQAEEDITGCQAGRLFRTNQFSYLRSCAGSSCPILTGVATGVTFVLHQDCPSNGWYYGQLQYGSGPYCSDPGKFGYIYGPHLTLGSTCYPP